MTAITDHRELKVYQKSFDAAMEIFRLSKDFPKEERYSLTDQIRQQLISPLPPCSPAQELFREKI